MSRGADKTDSAFFKVRKKDVLLSFVEAVNLINKQESALISELGVGAGLLDLCSNLSHIGFHSVQRFETRAGRIGHDPREGGFSGSGGAVENQGCESVCFNGAPEEFAFSEDVLLSCNIGE